MQEAKMGSKNAVGQMPDVDSEKGIPAKDHAGSDDAKPTKQGCSVPFLVLLLLASILPLIISAVMTWYFSSSNATTAIDQYGVVAESTTRNLVFSKLDSMIETQTEKFKIQYGTSYKIAAGGGLSNQLYDAYPSKIEELGFWSLTMGYPWNFDLVYFAYECNGHIIGGGHSTDNIFTVLYTTLTFWDSSKNTFFSPENIPYDANGCSTLDPNDDAARKELTHQQSFNTIDGWLDVLDPSFTPDPGFVYDARVRPWYNTTKHAATECTWSPPYISVMYPYPLTATIAVKSYDNSDNFVGTVAVDFSLSDFQSFTQKLITGFEKASAAILTKDGRVLATTDGNVANALADDGNGNVLAELYEFGAYGDVYAAEGNYRYKSVSDMIKNDAEFMASLQKPANAINIGEADKTPTPTHKVLTMDDGETLLVSALFLTDPCELDMTVLIMMEESELMEEIDEQNFKVKEAIAIGTRDTYIILPCISLGAAIIVLILSRSISKPLEEMKKDINKVRNLDFSGTFETKRPFITELNRISGDYGNLKTSLSEFKRFVPPHIVGELVDMGKGAATRTVTSRYVSFLFCDIANFTKAAHNSPPQIVADLANKFLGGSADLMSKYNGTVIDFFGDQIFGIFNAPFEDPKFIEKTIQCATEMLELFHKVKAEFVASNPSFQSLDVRIGLHVGNALTGKIGSTSRLKYCAVGDNVNLGSRIENMNKRYGSRMACSSDFFAAAGKSVMSKWVSRPMEYVKVQGRSEPVLIYEIAGVASDMTATIKDDYNQHTQMFEDAKTGRVTTNELEAFISMNGPNAEFLRSAITQGEDSEEVKKQE